MKRLICILLVVLLILSGCGNAHTGAESGAGTEGTQQTPTDSTTDTTTGQGGTTGTTTGNTAPTEPTEPSTGNTENGEETTPATKPTTSTTPTAPTNPAAPTEPVVPTEPTVPTTPPAIAEKCAHTSTTVINKKTVGCTSNGYTGDTVCSACSTVINKGQTISASGHKNTSLVNVASATCTVAGYTGDTYCNDCNTTISRGSSVAATGHMKTEIRNQKDATTSADGYTGDTVCVACNTITVQGSVIPMLQVGKITYTAANGATYTVDADVNISDYTMKLSTWSASHEVPAIEQEIFRLCNEARVANGLPALRWNEDAYCFTKIRANECTEWYDHIRPNGKKYYTVYSDNGVILEGYKGENICCAGASEDKSYSEDARIIFEKWMASSGHRANILSSNYTSISIALVSGDGDGDGHISYMAVQNFFGY